MHIFAVEKCAADLRRLRRAIIEAFPEAELDAFTDPMLAVKQGVTRSLPDLLLCEGELKHMDGFTLAEMLRRQRPELAVIILTEDEACRHKAEEHMLQAIKKPVTAQALRQALPTYTPKIGG